MKRPFILLGTFLSLGILTAGVTRSHPFIFYTSVGICVINVTLLLLIRAYEFKKIVGYTMAGVFFFLGGFLLLNRTHRAERDFSGYDDNVVLVTGVISSLPINDGDRIRFDLSCETVNGISRDGKLDVFAYDLAEEVSFNERVSLKGVFSFPQEKRNPGGMDYRKYMLSLGKQGSLFVYNGALEHIDNRGHHGFLMKLGNKIRDKGYRIIKENMEDDAASLMAAFLLGITADMDKDMKKSYSDSGLIHITAVSGLHISILVSFLISLFNLAGLHKKVASGIIMGVLGFYCIVTGFSNSVLRAVFMTSIAMAGQILNRENDSVTALFVVFTAMLLLNPHRLYNPGFILSFVSSLSIIVYSKKINLDIKEKFKVRSKFSKYLIEGASVSLAAQGGTLPLLLMWFCKVSPFTLPANLFASFLAFVAIGTGFIFLGISLIIPSLAPFFGYLAQIPIYMLTFISEFFSRLPFSSVRAGISSYISIPIYYIIFTCLIFFRDKIKVKGKRVPAILAGVVIFALIIFFLPRDLEVTFLDVGAGDSIYISMPGGKNMLIDGGGLKTLDREDEDTGYRILLPFLFSKGVRKIDYVVVTHGHNDHMNGIVTVLKHFKAGGLFLPDYTQLDEFDQLIGICEEKKIPVYRLNDTHSFKGDGNVSINVLNPPENLIYSTLNDSSLMIELVYGDVGFLLTGDGEGQAENHIITKGEFINTPIMVMKAGHHGSSTSTGEDFLRFVNPSMVVISTGRNSHGHPDKQVLERLEGFGLKVYRTDHNGAVSFYTRGKNIKVKVMID